MFQPMPVQWLAALSALSALTVSAQTPATPASAPPARAAAPAAAAASAATPAASAVAPKAAAPTPVAQSQTVPGQYRSALEGYQPYSENKMVPWKEANDTVGKIGGWRAYAKEAAEGQAPGAPAPAASGAANPHAGHGKQ